MRLAAQLFFPPSLSSRSTSPLRRSAPFERARPALLSCELHREFSRVARESVGPRRIEERGRGKKKRQALPRPARRVSRARPSSCLLVEKNSNSSEPFSFPSPASQPSQHTTRSQLSSLKQKQTKMKKPRAGPRERRRPCLERHRNCRAGRRFGRRRRRPVALAVARVEVSHARRDRDVPGRQPGAHDTVVQGKKKRERGEERAQESQRGRKEREAN